MRFYCAFLMLALVGCDDQPGFVYFDGGQAMDAGSDAGAADAGASDAGDDAGPDAGDDAGVADVGPVIPPEVQAVCDRVGPDWAAVCDVEQQHIVITSEIARPARARLFPGVDAYNMNGWEWWQRWPGGHAPTFEYDEATDKGVVCSVAAAIRFAAIMVNPPERLAQLRSETTWDGRFFNWNDDYSDPTATGEEDGDAPFLWAWQDHLIKWISQTNSDGSCELPTASMLESAVANCIRQGRAASGSIEGCTH